MKATQDKKKDLVNWVEKNGLSQHGGATLYAFCQYAGINKTTYYRWCEDDAQFKEDIQTARATFKANTIGEVVNAMLKKALGYEDEKTELYGYVGDDGQFVTEKAKKVKVNVAPDTGAGIFLLTNLDPQNWKNRQDNTQRIEEIQKADIQVISEEQKTELENARNGIRRKRESI